MKRAEIEGLHVWFWQRIITPHMAELASALAKRGCHVTYLAEQAMSADRLEQGWGVPELPAVRLFFLPTVESVSKHIADAPCDSIHICQGIRSNGLIKLAQRRLRERGLRQWVIMETVDDTGWRGLIRRIEYWRLFLFWRKHLQGVLAIGQATKEWVVSRGMLCSKVYSFAYFLADQDFRNSLITSQPKRFRFVFVGQFIELKRLDLLVQGLRRLNDWDFELEVIGSGPLEELLRGIAEESLPGRVQWVGRLPLKQVQIEMAAADCLILPSRHDGWGAVVSEALMVGTPVICSDKCGSAGVVRSSGWGGVFQSGDLDDLTKNLESVLLKGVIDESKRLTLAKWARCLGARSGATYLKNILEFDNGIGESPVPPWGGDEKLSASVK